MPQTATEIGEQIALRRERFKHIVAEIRAVLVEDVPAWVTREARTAFLSNPEAARAMSDADVAALKTRAEELGARSAEELDAALADDARWQEGASSTEVPRTLTDAAVWSAVTAVDVALAALLGEYGLAPQPAPSYKAPVYFVGGRFFPALAEHYWRLRGEIATLETEREELAAAEVRQALVARWDDA